MNPEEVIISELCRILVIWPTCPSETVQHFSRDTLQFEPTEAVINKARESLGLLQEQESQVLIERLVAKYIVIRLVSLYGKNGLKPEQFSVKVLSNMQRLFDSSLNLKVLNAVASSELERIKQFDIPSIEREMLSSRAALTTLNIPVPQVS